MFVWQEMLTHGFHLPAKVVSDYNDAQLGLGYNLLQARLPIALTSCGLPLDGTLDEVKERDPYLWKRLHGMAAFGYTQGRLIHGLRLGPEQLVELVAVAAALFNSGTALFDYVIDELAAHEELFAVVSLDQLAALLDLSQEPPLSDLFRGTESSGPELRLLLRYILAFVENCKRLYRFCPDPRAWERLSASIFDLCTAERAVSRSLQSAPESDDEWFDVAYCKSAGPTATIGLISQLTGISPSEYVEDTVRKITDTLGRIFWLADDLSDIAKDSRAGLPSYVTWSARRRQPTLHLDSTPISIREGVIGAVEDLCALLQRLEEQLGALPAPASVRDETLLFARTQVYSWLTE